MKIDFKKELKNFYSPTNEDWQKVDVPEMNYLMIDGKGDPNTSKDYQNAVEALFAVSYTVKFISKREMDKDYVVPPLEGLWYADDMSVFEESNKSEYKWTMMIMQPSWVEKSDRATIDASNKKDLPALSKLYFKKYKEGVSMQLLHVGGYDDEAPKLAHLHRELMPAQELKFNGMHHEIYLSDPRKVATSKLKTILRQPVK